MSKKIVGILAAIAVVVIITLVALNKPKDQIDRGMLEQPAEVDVAGIELVAPDTAAIDSTGIVTDSLPR